MIEGSLFLIEPEPTVTCPPAARDDDEYFSLIIDGACLSCCSQIDDCIASMFGRFSCSPAAKLNISEWFACRLLITC